MTDKLIEEIKETITMIRNDIIDNYLNDHGKTVINELDSTDGKSYREILYSDESHDEANEYADQQIKEALKQLKIN